MTQHKTPCKECPWRKDSAPGWLGASSPLEFAQQAEAGIKMPCHLTVDYECEDWPEQVETAPHCAGHAIYLANRCKFDRPLKDLVESDRESVFSNAQSFIEHHSNGEGPKVMFIGNNIVPMGDFS